jgi:cytochrome c553
MACAAFFVLLFPPNAATAQNPSAAQACAVCHGANGEGDPAGAAPRLAAQPAFYLERQLQAYAEDTRAHPVMGPIARAMSAEERSQAAAYYSGIDAPKVKDAAASEPSPRGRVLATKGDEARHVQACENCHGPGGSGLAPNHPYLAGLDRKYLESALEEWKTGARKTDPSQQMPMIARQLTAADTAAVSQHYASLAPPKPSVNSPVNMARRRDAPPQGAPTSAGAGAQPTQGVGVTGGDATTGGSQGPGGGGAATGSGASGSRSGGTP